MTKEELETRFTYHVPKNGQTAKYEAIRASAKTFAFLILTICPDSREQSTAFTKLDEVVFWANASIARRE